LTALPCWYRAAQNECSFTSLGGILKPADKRTEVMNVALGLMAEHGFHGVPMSTIAERSGVAVGTIYLYFRGKDELIVGLCQELERHIVAYLREGFPTGGSVRERFVYLVGRVIRYFIDHPVHFRYLEQFMNSPYGISMRRDRLLDRTGHDDIFLNLFEEAMAMGAVKDLPREVLFSVSIAPMIFLARDHVLGFIELDDVLIQKAAEACWDAVRRC